MNPMSAFKTRIELTGSSPLIWRSVLIPAGATFQQLYEIVQLAMGWRGEPGQNDRVYAFLLPEENIQITNDGEALAALWNRDADEAVERADAAEAANGADAAKAAYGAEKAAAAAEARMETLDPAVATLDEYLARYGELDCVHDPLGRPWRHRLVLEDLVDDYELDYPTLLEAAGECPPEDIQNFTDFTAFLEAYSDPDHPGHEDALALALDKAYIAFDMERQNERLAALRLGEFRD